MRKQSYLICVAVVGFLFCYKATAVVDFEPSVGAGLRFTDNARLTPVEPIEDIVAMGYVGARVSENEGPFQYGATTSLEKQNYTQDSYDDKRYFQLDALVNWEMVKDHFNWL